MSLRLCLTLFAAFIAHGDCASVTNDSVPINVQITAVSPHVVRVTWDPPPNPRGFLMGYAVSWYSNGNYQGDSPYSRNRVEEISGLKPGQNISVVVTVVSQIRENDDVKVVHLRSEEVSGVTPLLVKEKEEESTTTKLVTMSPANAKAEESTMKLETTVSTGFMWSSASTTIPSGPACKTLATAVMLTSVIMLLHSAFH